MQRAVGRKLSSVAVKTTTDQDLLPSLDNYYTKKYNNCDNFSEHSITPFQGRIYAVGVRPYGRPQTPLYQKSLKNFITSSMRNLPKSFCSFGNLFIQFFSFNIIAIQQQKIKIYQRVCYV